MDISEWIPEIEQTYKYKNFYRCFTDEKHGFYFDVFPKLRRAINQDGARLTDNFNQIPALIADFIHGEN